MSRLWLSEHPKSWGADLIELGSRLTRGGWAGAKLVWRVKLVAELRPGVTTETDVSGIEGDEQAGLAELGLWLEETKQLAEALQAEIVPAQVAALGERRRSCMVCGRVLASKGHYGARFRSLSADVPVRIRRLLVCPCQDVIEGGAKSFAVLDLGGDAAAPGLACVTARHSALLPFGKVATVLSELLSIGGAQNTGTARNGTLRVGQDVVCQHVTESVQHPRRNRRALSWLGWMAATCAAGTGETSATSRWSRAR